MHGVKCPRYKFREVEIDKKIHCMCPQGPGMFKLGLVDLALDDKEQKELKTT